MLKTLKIILLIILASTFEIGVQASSPDVVVTAPQGSISISVLAPPGTIYDWIGGVPAKTDNTYYDWVGGTPFIRLEVVAGGEPDISVSPDTWTLNDIVGDGYTLKGTIAPNRTYYSNPFGDGIPPSATVQAGECQFTLTNASTVAITIVVNSSDFSGGSATMTNSNTGANGATSYGGYSWYQGMTYANKVIMKTADSGALWTSPNPGDDIKLGFEIETQENDWTGSTSSNATITITATAS